MLLKSQDNCGYEDQEERKTHLCLSSPTLTLVFPQERSEYHCDRNTRYVHAQPASPKERHLLLQLMLFIDPQPPGFKLKTDSYLISTQPESLFTFHITRVSQEGCFLNKQMHMQFYSGPVHTGPSRMSLPIDRRRMSPSTTVCLENLYSTAAGSDGLARFGLVLVPLSLPSLSWAQRYVLGLE